MRVLVCPTAFKGSFGAADACAAVVRGLEAARPTWRLDVQPLSDGGPGLLDALGASRGPGVRDTAVPARGRLERVEVPGPLGNPVEARLLWLGREAVLESADACGLERLGEERAPLEADTRGVGALVRHALGGGATAVRIGLGGSASTDGGTGMARAFGWRFLDARGEELPAGGGALRGLARIEPGDRPGDAAGGAGGAGGTGDAEITALADVETPLLGPRGAARTFAPQKGASEAEVEMLAAGLDRLAARLESDLGGWASEAVSRPGSGAAGGLGAGCAVFLGARLVPGAAWVLERTRFDERLARADLVVTGEGAWDRSSAAGKITWEVLRRARESGVPALLLCGRLDAEPPEGVRALDGRGAWLDAPGLERLAARAADFLQEPGDAR
jgi:glycerate kinase